MKKTIFFPAGGPRRVFLLASRLPSNASYRFLVDVLPEKLTNVANKSVDGSAVVRNSLVITDFPTPVSPVINTL